MSTDDLTLYNFCRQVVGKHGTKPAARTRVKKGGEWNTLTYEDWNKTLELVALGLISTGVNSQDKVMLVCDNRQEFMIICMGITNIGAIDVPRGTDATVDDLAYIANHTEAGTLFVENQKAVDTMKTDWAQFSKIHTIITINEGITGIDDKKVLSFQELLDAGNKHLTDKGPEAYYKRGEAIKEEDLSTIIYTSGTTGTPKGVMLSHKNQVWSSKVGVNVVGYEEGSSTMCYLPPWHIAERMIQMVTLYMGAIGYYTTVATIVADLADAKPRVMLGVPRVWESIYNKIHDGAAAAGGVKLKLFNFAKAGAIQLELAKEYIRGRIVYPGPVPASEHFKRFLYFWFFPSLLIWGGLGKVILGKVRTLFGGNLTHPVSGAGHLPHKVDLFFRAAGLKIIEVYGMTETTAVLSHRIVDCNKLETLGRAAKGTELQLRSESGQVIDKPAEKGVVWTRGPQIMMGYYKNEEKTKETIDENGWLNTGDLGQYTTSGDLVYSGRAKDTIVLMGGENIEPEPIEDKIKESPFVNQVMVAGQDQKNLCALITPSLDAVKDWSVSNNISLGEDQAGWNTNPDLRRLFKQEIKSLVSNTSGFKAFERVSNFYIMHKDFEPGVEMTQTLKLRRNVIADLYAKEISNMYE